MNEGLLYRRFAELARRLMEEGQERRLQEMVARRFRLTKADVKEALRELHRR